MLATGELHAEITKLLRIQRHDFVNHLQVIHTMIQLDKSDLALNYIMELSRNPDALVTEELHAEMGRVIRKDLACAKSFRTKAEA